MAAWIVNWSRVGCRGRVTGCHGADTYYAAGVMGGERARGEEEEKEELNARAVWGLC